MFILHYFRDERFFSHVATFMARRLATTEVSLCCGQFPDVKTSRIVSGTLTFEYLLERVFYGCSIGRVARTPLVVRLGQQLRESPYTSTIDLDVAVIFTILLVDFSFDEAK